MKKLVTGTLITLGVLLAFGTGVYAAENWLNYEGVQAIGDTETNIDELVSIIDKLEEAQGENDGLEEHYENQIKELQEQFQTQLEEVTRSKDAEIQDLQEQLADADDSEYVEHLENELQKANEQAEAIERYSRDALKKSKGES